MDYDFRRFIRDPDPWKVPTPLPGPIVTEVVSALRAAEKRTRPGDARLVAVGHSMGGIILYDVLTAFAPDLRIDALITVGSQVAVFEEMKLYLASDPARTGSGGLKVPKPANVGAWVNVFDRNDVLAFATSGVFDGAADFEFVTGKGVLGAHSSYFVRPSFHERLRAVHPCFHLPGLAVSLVDDLLLLLQAGDHPAHFLFTIHFPLLISLSLFCLNREQRSEPHRASGGELNQHRQHHHYSGKRRCQIRSLRLEIVHQVGLVHEIRNRLVVSKAGRGR